ncbi:MAG: ATP-binding protein [Flavisolibacter sp.]
MRPGVTIILLLVASLAANAQAQKKDSLLQLLSTAKEDTSKVMQLLQMASIYETNNQDSSVFYLEQSKRLSDLLKFKKGLYHYYAESFIVSFTKGNYELAMQQSKNALTLAREINDSDFIIRTLGNTGIVYQYLGEFDKQLEYSLLTLQLIENRKDSKKLAPMYQNIANAYFNLHQYRKAIEYCFLSSKFYQTGGVGYTNRLYATLGQAYAMLNKTDSALYYYTIAIEESGKVDDTYAEAAIYGYMANTYADRNEYKEMKTVSERSLTLSRKLQSNQMLASSLYNIAYANYFNGNNDVAKANIYQALDIAIKDSLKDELKNIYSVLSFIAARDGDFKSSLWAKKKNDSIQEGLFNQQIIKSTTELEKKYESEKKDKQIKLQQAQLQQRRFWNYVLISSVAALLIISLLSYRNYKQKQKLQQQHISELENAKQLTATEAVLKGEAQERTRLAKDLHDGLGGMMSGIKYSLLTMKRNQVMTAENNQAFERSMDMLDSSINEMRRVAHNMMPEALVKFGLDTALKDFCNDINGTGYLQVIYQSMGIDSVALEQTTAISIYRIVQELINNTMKHASAKSAIVQLTKTNEMIAITVEDDGKGFTQSVLQQTKGMGWNNIQSRIEYLKGSMDVQSGTEKGTSVHIELNI